MYNSKYKVKHTIVNKFKLIYLPLFIGLFAILAVSAISYYTSKNLLLTKMKQNGVNLAKETVLQVEGNAVSLETVNKMIEEKIRIVGKAVIMNQGDLSSDLLKKTAKNLDVDEINWFSPEGEIIYSTIDAYMGVKVPKGHPVEQFAVSGKDEMMEEVRKDTESDNYRKYGYIRNADGSFVQIGIKANEVESLTTKFNYQTLVEKLAKGENINNVLLLDKNLNAIADSNIKDVGIKYDKNLEKEMREALTGKTTTINHYSQKQHMKSLDIYMPIVKNGETTNVLVLYFSTEDVYSSIYMLFIILFIIALSMFLMFFWVQNRNIIKPVNRLDQYINQIDIEKNVKFRLPIKEKETFFGIAFSINNILEKAYNYFYQVKEQQEELQASNEEIIAAYQQLAASEEELRAQYDEIQSYTEKLEDLKQKYEIAIEGTNSAVWEFDIKDESIYFSEGVKNILGISFKEKESIHKVLNQFLNDEDQERLIKKFTAYKDRKKEEIYDQVHIKDIDGNSKWILIRGKGILGNNNNIRMINGILLDITYIKNQEERIEHIAYHDSLTDLPNRRKFIKELEKEISENKSGAVIILDLDNFKGINDTLGHIYGDKVLNKVAKELESINERKIFVSRFGGDEFFILIQDEKDVIEIENYANKIISIFRNKLMIEKEEVYIGCSMGITLYPFHSNEVNQLIMNADMAMYKVKNEGKNNYMFFNEKMTEKLQEHIKIEKILRKAIKKDGFKLLYQPQVCTFTGKIVGFEALLRLKNYAISPAQFISIAEETGIIIEIGRWVTKEAINQIALWKKKGFDIKPMAINFSARQLNDLGFIRFLKNTLKDADVEARYIDIEITESIFLEKKEETIEFLNQLKDLGVKISLDDFGTGYSSLSYLTFLPVDKIKIDKSLNDKFLELENIKVMDSLISLAHSLKLAVVAEGIEELEQYKRLKVAGCDYIQGYLFSKPLESEQAEKVYNDNFLEKLKHSS